MDCLHDSGVSRTTGFEADDSSVGSDRVLDDNIGPAAVAARRDSCCIVRLCILEDKLLVIYQRFREAFDHIAVVYAILAGSRASKAPLWIKGRVSLVFSPAADFLWAVRIFAPAEMSSRLRVKSSCEFLNLLQRLFRDTGLSPFKSFFEMAFVE